MALAFPFPLVFDLDLEGEAEVDEWRVASDDERRVARLPVGEPSTSLSLSLSLPVSADWSSALLASSTFSILDACLLRNSPVHTLRLYSSSQGNSSTFKPNPEPNSEALAEPRLPASFDVHRRADDTAVASLRLLPLHLCLYLHLYLLYLRLLPPHATNKHIYTLPKPPLAVPSSPTRNHNNATPCSCPV